MSIPNPLPPHDMPSVDDPEMDPTDERGGTEQPPSEGESTDLVDAPPGTVPRPAPDEGMDR